MKRIAFYLITLTVSFAPVGLADPRGDQLINNYLNQTSRREAVVNMHVQYQEAANPPVELEFTWMRKLQNGLMSHLIRIDSPPSEKGKLLLVREKDNGDAEYVAYRPNSALKKKVRISAARNYKYKGLTISVQELIGGELGKYDHALKESQTVDGVVCDVVENRLKAEFKDDSNYPRSLCYVRRDNGMLQKWELFGNSNQLEKIIRTAQISKIQGVWTVVNAHVEDLKKKGKLTLNLKHADYHPDLKDSLFSEEYLKRNSQ